MWREKLQSEARAKIFWGDSVESVIEYLQSQGFTPEEAVACTNEILTERLANVRSHGRNSILMGIPLLLVPVASFFALNQLGIFPIKIFAITVVVGLFGGWKLVRGIGMIASPHSISGDLSDPAET